MFLKWLYVKKYKVQLKVIKWLGRLINEGEHMKKGSNEEKISTVELESWDLISALDQKG